MSLDAKTMRDLEVLLAVLTDGTLSAEQRARLNTILREHPEAKRFYQRYIELHVMLQWESGVAVDTAGDNDLLSELLRAERDAETIAFPQQVFEPQPTDAKADPLTLREIGSATAYLLNKPKVWGSLAAVLAVALLLLVVFRPGTTPAPFASDPNDPTDPGNAVIAQANTVATLTATNNAQWAQASLAPGSVLRAGQRLTLTAGFAEITTASGAVAILQAPTTVELFDNDNALRLHAGKLVGICETESSKGFTVRTPHMDVIDLGTRFGVAIDDEGNTLAEVFQGSIEVQSSSGSNALSPPERLTRGEFFAVSPAGTRMTREQFDLMVFAPLVEAATGLRLTGDVRSSFYAFDVSDIGQWPSDPTNALVIEEMRDYRVPSDFPVLLDKPGTLSTFSIAPTSQVSAGTRIRSYAVLFNPGTTGDEIQCRGEVTFEGEVLGVIANRTVGNAFITAIGEDDNRVLWDSTPRSRAWPEDGDGGDRTDSLVLKLDGRTLVFKFSVQSESDMVRIIVREPAEGQPAQADQPTKED